MPRSAATVIIVSYCGRDRIDISLRALQAQDVTEPFEIVVVASGDDGCAEYLQTAYPEIRIVRSLERLRPGPARNRGIDASTGTVIAFVPDDGVPHRDWLRRRLELHRQGADAVGGSIVNAVPGSYVARAAHLLEYSALLPYDAVLRAQEVPHCLSYHRRVFEQVGRYPENTITGEDTIFNLACRQAGISYAFSGHIRMGHIGLTSLRANLSHAHEHGRGLMQCTERHRLGSMIGSPHRFHLAAWRALVCYPVVGLTTKARRLRKAAPNEMGGLLIASPVIAMLLVATGLGALAEWHTSRI